MYRIFFCSANETDAVPLIIRKKIANLDNDSHHASCAHIIPEAPVRRFWDTYVYNASSHSDLIVFKIRS